MPRFGGGSPAARFSNFGIWVNADASHRDGMHPAVGFPG